MDREEQLRQVIDKYSLKYSMPCSDDAYHFALDILNDIETMRQVGWVREEEELEFVLPKGYFNVEITTDYKYLIADTNDSTNWDKIKIPLPKGTWVIKSNFGKCVVIINRQLPKPKPSVMIQANELRIGNWLLNYQNEPIKVFAIEFEPHKTPNPTQYIVVANCSYDLESCKPIHLTPEILEKCGFIWSHLEEEYQLTSKVGVIFLSKDGYSVSTGTNDSFIRIFGLTCKYLHQLQNLYFAMTGEELKVQL